MSDHAILHRAQQLLQLERFDEAEQILKGHLAETPNDSFAMLLLAETALGQRQTSLALSHAQDAVGMSPDWALAHFTLARVQLVRRRPQEAEQSVREAVSLQPADPDNHALLAQILLHQSRQKEALAACEAGLAEDPEHEGCLVLKSHALMQLGRAAEAAPATAAHLSRDPDNPYAHVAHARACLHSGDYPTACQHFREALRLDPDNESARQGVREALKAHNPLYRPVLTYLLWMQRFSVKAQGLMVLGAWLGFQGVRRLRSGIAGTGAEAWVGPVLTGLVVAYLVLVATSWFAVPLANAFLLLSPLGRLATNLRERSEALAITGLLLAGVLLWQLSSYSESGLLLIVFAAAVQASTFVPIGPQYRWMAAFLALTLAGLVYLVQVDVRSVAAGFDRDAIERVIAYDERSEELNKRLASARGSGGQADSGLMEEVSAHRAQQGEMEVLIESQEAFVEMRKPLGALAIFFAIQCVWVSQYVAGALRGRSELR